MTPTEALTRFLREQPPAPMHERKPPTEGEIRARIERARSHASLHALLTAMTDLDTSFELFELRMYPAVLVREPWDDGVMTERDLCVGKNGGGDLYLWNMDDGGVRLVVHDEGWAVRRSDRSFDEWLVDRMWSGLENVEPDDLEDMDDALRERVRLALTLAGTRGLRAESRDKLIELGLLAG